MFNKSYPAKDNNTKGRWSIVSLKLPNYNLIKWQNVPNYVIHSDHFPNYVTHSDVLFQKIH